MRTREEIKTAAQRGWYLEESLTPQSEIIWALLEVQLDIRDQLIGIRMEKEKAEVPYIPDTDLRFK